MPLSLFKRISDGGALHAPDPSHHPIRRRFRGTFEPMTGIAQEKRTTGDYGAARVAISPDGRSNGWWRGEMRAALLVIVQVDLD
jgi:hypothetical protein